MRIGVLTAGGDCPGLNAVIRSVVHRAVVDYGNEVIGFRDGWRGLLEATTAARPRRGRRHARPRRHDPRLGPGRSPRSCATAWSGRKGMLAALGIDALIPIGGEGTLRPRPLLSRAGVPVVGVPKTIDNDIDVTDRDLRLRHRRQRRHRGDRPAARPPPSRTSGCWSSRSWAGTPAGSRCTPGMAAGAHAIVVPERPFDIDELAGMVERAVRARASSSRSSSSPRARTPRPGTMDVRATAAMDEYGHERFTGVGPAARRRAGAAASARRRGRSILGHVQRGGTPTSYDRVLATRFGWHAVEAAHRGEFGQMTALRGTEIEMVPLAEAVRDAEDGPDGAVRRGGVRALRIRLARCEAAPGRRCRSGGGSTLVGEAHNGYESGVSRWITAGTA